MSSRDMGDYQRLQTDAEAELYHNPELGRSGVYYVKPMSYLHMTAVASSVVFCLCVMLFFVWGLPCNVSPCYKESPDTSWDKTLFGLELKGRMHFVGGNLIAILRSAKWGSNRFSANGGVIALNGKTGTESYWLPLPIVPRFIDCSMLDIKTNGVKACLIVGDGGYLTALNPVSGLTVWTIKAKDKSIPQPSDIDVPVLIHDMDSDGIRDLATLSRLPNDHHRLIFVSGKTGVITKEHILSQDCLMVNNLTYDDLSSTLYYTCSDKINTKTESYTMNDRKSMNYVESILIPDEIKYGFAKGNSSAGEHKVTVSNSGTCPDDCSVSVNVTDSKNRTIWTFHTTRAYIMYPVSLHFKHSITGFLLKLWQWHNPIEKVTKSVEGITVELIQERILLITFNKSGNMHVVNASQFDIVQLCYNNECQPHLSFQTQSAMMADLNGDGTKDLISYFVTYKPNTEDFLNMEHCSVKDWVLESRVKSVRLEAELPKLYEAVSKH